MSNGDVEIHDSISNLKNGTDPRSTSDTSDMEDTVEFRILMAYTQRRHPKKPAQDSLVIPNGNANGTAPSQEPAKTELKVTNNKKKKGWKGVLSIFKCVKPQTEEESQQIPEEQNYGNRSFDSKDAEVEEEGELVQIACKLTEIADEIPFTPPDIEPDGPEDNVEKAIGLILRESGDRLNEQELKKLKELFWDYSFFKTLMTTLLMTMGLKSPNPDSPGPHASPKTQIAVTCEATSRLSALDTLPMNQLLGFGARYLNEYHSSWAKELGGYEAAFESDDEDDVQ